MVSKKVYVVLLIIIAAFFTFMFLTFGVDNIKENNYTSTIVVGNSTVWDYSNKNWVNIRATTSIEKLNWNKFQVFSNNENIHKSWLRPHRTELDPDENPVIVAGDSVRVLVKKKTKITYTVQGGTSGPRVYTDEATAQVVSLCELMTWPGTEKKKIR